MSRKVFTQQLPVLDASKAQDLEGVLFGVDRVSERPLHDQEESFELDSDTPEADRLFPPPSAELAAHTLRELGWGEHIMGSKTSAGIGDNQIYIYSLPEAVGLFLNDRSGPASIASRGVFSEVDTEEFIPWLRDVVGDVDLANVMEAELEGLTIPNERMQVVSNLLLLRITQYVPFLKGAWAHMSIIK